MITLSQETEALARRLADVRRIPVEEAVRQALEASAREAGVQAPGRRRMTVEEMLALGAEIAAMPLLDRRSPQEIADDLDSL